MIHRITLLLCNMGAMFGSLWKRLFDSKEFKICIVGLDNAGKVCLVLCCVSCLHPTFPNSQTATESMVALLSCALACY
jgi:hypothetical protein